jgi:hypothetical protein
MSSVRRVLLTIALGAALGAGPAIAGPAMAKHNSNNDKNRSVQLSALLGDNQVVGEPADSDGWGAVNLRVRSNGWVCYTYYVSKVENANNLAVYFGGRGNANADNDKRLTLAGGGTIGQGCKKVSKFFARNLSRWPSLYNVQVDGSNGAIRGQLHRGGGNNNNW